jgi:2,3-bisphosphoglycerate-independent phosphoglycerate mutase
MKDTRVLLFFIDGLGIGQRGAANPFDGLEGAAPLAVFEDEEPGIPFGGVLSRTDASLGVEGRPQSASGQTTILTGINAPEFLGYHKQGFPNQALREVIVEHSIFKQLESAGVTPNAFANAYTPQFFETTPRWKAATTCAVEASRTVKFRTLDDLRAERAVFTDFTNSVLNARGIEMPEWSPEKAGGVLADLVKENRFTLFEYFITDKIGHAQDFEQARHVLPVLARMLRATIENLDLATTNVIMTSDHGNIEDLSRRQHTLNRVPTIVWGANSRKFASRIKSLADITPTITSILSNPGC